MKQPTLQDMYEYEGYVALVNHWESLERLSKLSNREMTERLDRNPTLIFDTAFPDGLDTKFHFQLVSPGQWVAFVPAAAVDSSPELLRELALQERRRLGKTGTQIIFQDAISGAQRQMYEKHGVGIDWPLPELETEAYNEMSRQVLVREMWLSTPSGTLLGHLDVDEVFTPNDAVIGPTKSGDAQ